METKIKFTDEQLKIIDIALEAFCRGRTGQFGILMEFLFPELDYDKRKCIEDRVISFFAENDLGFTKNKTDLKMWDMHKLFDEYLSVKKNGGWGNTVNFQGPINQEGLPEIEGFSEWVEFIFPDKMQGEIKRMFEDEDYLTIANIAQDLFNVEYYSASRTFLKEKEEKFLTTKPKEVVVVVEYKRPIFNK